MYEEGFLNSAEIEKHIISLGDREYKERIEGYFKTGPGEYGEGDIFIGIRMPALRKEIKQFRDISPLLMAELLRSCYHEVRMFALLLMVHRFKSKNSAESEQEEIYNHYMENISFVNNWDLVDSSAHHILGPWLETRDHALLFELAHSESLWKRRIAVIATFHFINSGEYDDSFRLALLLIRDPEDLIQKAVGWMLREIGNRSREEEERFLRRHYRNMPRTMLRYAIEKFPENIRRAYLAGDIE